MRIQDVAKEWGITRGSLYYWIKKQRIDIKKINEDKDLSRFREAKKYRSKFVRNYSYHYYLKKMVTQKRMTKKQMDIALNDFYRNRDIPEQLL